MDKAPILSLVGTQLVAYKGPLRYCFRITVAALLAFALAQLLPIPLHGLWAVLTAVIVTQLSVGGSLGATTDYVIGTFGGVLYAGALGALLPHATALELAGVLALTVAPLAYAAAVNPSFRVAPFTGALVLLISSQLGEGPIESALYRLLEVALGGAVAVVVSLLVLPDRAHRLGLDAAARSLDQLASVLLKLLTAFTQQADSIEIGRLQDETGRSVAAFQAIATEARRERRVNLVAEPDPAPLSRTLLRLRHDLVIIGRAGVLPLPDVFAQRLGPLLAPIGASASVFMHGSARALVSRCPAPSVDQLEAALAAYTSEITALRNEGLTLKLSSNEAEHLFALGFALEQLHQNLSDLARCVEEWAQPAAAGKGRRPSRRADFRLT